MSGGREQFTFYRSYYETLKRLKKGDREAVLMAIIAYALDETLPELPEGSTVSIVFPLIKPTLDAGRRKAEGGARGGRAGHRQDESCPEACLKDTPGEGEAERENKVKAEGEKENECAPPPPRHRNGQYGWVKLSDAQYDALFEELGREELCRCISYVDESAQRTGNRNKWRDWNLVIRKCAREGWGKGKAEVAGRLGWIDGVAL